MNLAPEKKRPVVSLPVAIGALLLLSGGLLFGKKLMVWGMLQQEAAKAGEAPSFQSSEVQRNIRRSADSSGVQKTRKLPEEKPVTISPGSESYCELRFGIHKPQTVILGVTDTEYFVYRDCDVTSEPEKYVRENVWPFENGPEFMDLDKNRYRLVGISQPMEGRKDLCWVFIDAIYAPSATVDFQQSGTVELSENPTDLNYSHFNGPLKIGVPIRNRFLFRLGGPALGLQAFVGTYDSEKSTAVLLSHKDHEDQKIHPNAKIKFPAPEGKLITKDYSLNLRNSGVFYQQISPPDGVVPGTARVTLSFDSWPAGNVRPSTFEIPVMSAP